MNIRFLNNLDVVYNLELNEIASDTVQLTGNNISSDCAGGFEVIEYNENNEIYVVQSYSGYKTIYDIQDNYIILTSDTNIYYNYLVYDKETFFVKEIQTRTNQEVDSDYYLIQCGQGKEYKEFSYPIFDREGFYLYKVVNNELVNITKEERNAFLEGKKYALVFDTVKTNKINEINVVCNQSIEEGIDYNGMHYSYSNDDQKNIATLMKFVESTGLSVPYHADGQSCRAYTPEEFIAIYTLQNYNLMHHTSYANQLKLYVKSLSSLDEIEKVMYGQDLTGKYLDTYNEMIAMTKALAEQSLGVSSLNL